MREVEDRPHAIRHKPDVEADEQADASSADAGDVPTVATRKERPIDIALSALAVAAYRAVRIYDDGGIEEGAVAGTSCIGNVSRGTFFNNHH